MFVRYSPGQGRRGKGSEAGQRHRNVIPCLMAPLTPSKGGWLLGSCMNSVYAISSESLQGGTPPGCLQGRERRCLPSRLSPHFPLVKIHTTDTHYPAFQSVLSALHHHSGSQIPYPTATCSWKPTTTQCRQAS